MTTGNLLKQRVNINRLDSSVLCCVHKLVIDIAPKGSVRTDGLEKRDNKSTSSYPGWIKSPHVVTLRILKLSGG